MLAQLRQLRWLIAAAVTITATIGVLAYLATLPPSSGYRRTSRCTRTELFPFKVGCPTASGCARYRPEVRTTPMHRFGAIWSFGDIGQLHDARLRKGGALTRHFPLLLPAFARSFLATEDALESRIPHALPVETLLQRAIHLSLSYVCCVTQREVDVARGVVERFAARIANLSVPLRVDSLQCWHERVNSVTNILVADAASQRRLMRLNHELAHALTVAGVPVFVARAHQMPFHFTLLGLHTSQNRSISPHLSAIANAVAAADAELPMNVSLRGKLSFVGGRTLDDNPFHS